MAKKKRFQTRVECVRMDPEEQSLCQRKSIPHRTANHRECTGLPCGSMCKKDKGPRYTRPSAYMLSLACRIVLEGFPRQGERNGKELKLHFQQNMVPARGGICHAMLILIVPEKAMHNCLTMHTQ